MAESACVARSFSLPSDSYRQTNENDPFRALTESISFGRYATESLDWERWSTFTHNRYLDEVQKLAKPGSVAEKKAFFEAHYKKRAEMKAGAKPEEPNKTSKSVLQVESTKHIPKPPSTSAVIKTEPTNDLQKCWVEHTKLAKPNTSEDTSIVSCSFNSTLEGSVVTIQKEGVELEEQHLSRETETTQLVDNLVKLENQIGEVTSLVEKSPSEHDPVKSGSPNQAGKSVPPSNVNLEKKARESDSSSSLGSHNKERPLDASSRSPTCEIISSGSQTKLDSHNTRRKSYSSSRSPITNKNSRATQTTSSLERDVTDKKMPVPKSVHMSMNFASRVSRSGKTLLGLLKNSPTSLKAASARAWNKTTTAATSCEIPTEALNTKKNSVRKSINVANSNAGETSKMPYKPPKLIASARQVAPTVDKNAVGVFPKVKRVEKPKQKSVPMSVNFSSCGLEGSKTSRGTAVCDANHEKKSIRAVSSKHPLKVLLPEDKRSYTKGGSSMEEKGKVAAKVTPKISRTSATVSKSVSGMSTHAKPLISGGGRAGSSSIVPCPFTFRSDERAAKRKEFFKKLEEKSTNEMEKEQVLIPTRPKMPLTTRLPSAKLGKKPASTLGQSTTKQHTPRSLVNNNGTTKQQRKATLSSKNTHENASPNIQY